MKLGLGLDLYRAKTLYVPVDLVKLCEDHGYHSVWTAEAYGSDALTPLAFLAAHTRRIKLATGIVQIAARTPAATAMHAMSIDHLAGGSRVIIGLGVSGPQIVEGWYGQPWGTPNTRLRDYVAIMRKVLARDEPVTHDGGEISLPYTGPGSNREGKALKSILHPAGEVEIWIAAGGPMNTALAGEVADGWLPMGEGPDSRVALERGFERRGGRPDGFDVFGNLTIEVTDDVQAAIDARKPLTGMYVGGMGSRDNNVHRDAMARRGFPDEAQRIQDLWLAGEKEQAIAAVPDEYVDMGSLMGSPDRIRQRWDQVAVGEGLTGYTIRGNIDEAYVIAAEMTGARDTVEVAT